jgi:hypothetical protein
MSRLEPGILTDTEASPEAHATLRGPTAVPIVAAAPWLEHAALAARRAINIVTTRETLRTAITNAGRVDSDSRNAAMGCGKLSTSRGASGKHCTEPDPSPA